MGDGVEYRRHGEVCRHVGRIARTVISIEDGMGDGDWEVERGLE